MFKVRLLQPEIDYTTRRVIARFVVNEGNFREFYDVADKEKDFEISIRRHRQKRSLNANAFFHVLVGKIAQKVGSSEPEVKNRMLGLYGQMELDDDGRPVFMIVRDDVPVEKWQELHLRPTDQTQELKGVRYRVFITLRGSHTYTTQEMSTLIDGTISEAKEAGIPEAEIMSAKDAKLLRDVYGVTV